MPITTGLPKKSKQEAAVIKPAAVKTTTKPKSGKAQATISDQLVIDWPKDGETLKGPQYAVRITTALPGTVEISVNSKPWKACRPSVGFWWYDWTAAPGKQTLQLRIKTPDGKIKKSKVTNCQYPA